MIYNIKRPKSEKGKIKLLHDNASAQLAKDKHYYLNIEFSAWLNWKSGHLDNDIFLPFSAFDSAVYHCLWSTKYISFRVRIDMRIFKFE